MIIIPFLEGLNAVDLGLFVAGEDFAATQDMTETLNQEVTYHGGFGVDGPILRTVRKADADEVSFSALLLKQGVARGLNDESTLKTLRDFEIITRRGDGRQVYTNCNWTSISISSTQDSVTLNCTVSVPGYSRS